MIPVMSQLELFSQPSVAVQAVPTVESVRERIEAVLGRLRGASVMPLSAKESARWAVVLPQMTDWLPPEEKAAVCAEFEAHLARLGSVKKD
jgi:hypothetical protein